MIQICISLGRPVRVRMSPQARYEEFQGVIVEADQPHQVVASSREPIIFLWIDPEDRAAGRLRASVANGEALVALSEPLMSILRNLLAAYPLNASDCGIAHAISRHLLRAVSSEEADAPLDERVNAVIQLLRGHRTLPALTVEELAETVFLSPSRLMHLFREQVGLPIRRYALWQRLLDALHHMSNGKSITEAAHAAAFSDAAHLTRTFRSMFGIAPSELFKNSRFIQAIACYDT